MKVLSQYLCTAIISFCSFTSSEAVAMEFKIGELNGREVLFASGVVEIGDAERYRNALEQVDVQAHGARLVVLDSPGGSVSAALRISEVNDDFVVHMLIPDGALCASACASIIFISGDFRTMSRSGRFGQHSCSNEGLPQPDCNEAIAAHATEHGVAHGSVKAFVTYVPPSEILWFNTQQLDCTGITHYPFSRQSGFGRSDPCFFETLKGYKPEAQSAWRVNLKDDGYRAFSRVVSDDDREFELGLHCDETKPSQLFLEFDLTGPAAAIEKALTTGYIILGTNRSIPSTYSVKQVDAGFTRITFSIPTRLVRETLIEADRLGVHFDVVNGYQPISSWVGTASSREALLFVANHCINRL